MKKFLLGLIVALTAISLFSDTATIDGIMWNYQVNDGEAEIFGEDGVPAIPEDTSGSITIPSSLGGCPVTSIGSYAVEDRSGLTSVTIGNSVTNIGDRAFSYCSGLTSITIPNSVTSIGDHAFSYCSGLTSITIPNSVTSIGDSAFSDCRGLTSITIPDSVTSIGSYAFEDCCGLTSVTIGNSVTSIGYGAFEDCSGLTSITIPNSVTSIGYYAFSGCSGLTSITIPNSVTSIRDCAFSNCSGLTQFIVDSNNPNYKSVNGLLLSKDGKTLIAGVDGDVVIPDGVTSIEYGAFEGCSGLTSITIPDSVTSIGFCAFEGCRGLTSITIPNSVTSIGDRAFSDCSGLTQFIVDSNNPNYKSVNGLLLSKDGKTLIAGINGDVVIPDGVTSIESEAFSGCSGLTSITIPNSVTSIGYWVFSSCSGLTSVTIPNSVTNIEHGAFSGCSGFTSVTIPNSVTSIGYGAFRGCSGLTNIIIPDSVTSIGDGAFEDCSGLTSVTIPNSVTSIEHGAFSDCSGLTNITIPDSVTSIGDSAFRGCSGLTSVTMPNSVTSIGYYAFSDCSGLTSITIPDSVTSIGYGAFRGCSGLTSVTIGNSVTSIGFCAFYACSGLTSITIPNSVTSIGDGAFEDCRGLTSITIPNSVTGIGYGAFRGCSGLTSITIGNSVTSIGYYAFSSCSGLTSITIPNSVTSIGDEAFGYCDNLKSAIFLGDAPRNVGDDIFYNCADDFTIKVKKGTKGWNGDPNSTELPETWCGYQIEYAKAAVIKDVKFRQRYPWNNKVDIDYTIVGETNDVIVSFIVKDNDVGKTYTPLSFDKVPPITEGTHRITWDAYADGISITSTNVVVGVDFAPPPLYIVVDLSGGTSAANYQVTTLSDVPTGGWADEYKTTKLVLRKITAGKMPRTDVDITLTKDYYVGVFEVTQKQWELVMGSNPSYFDGDTLPVEQVSYEDIRGTSNGSQWPASNAVDATSFMGKLRAKTGIDFDLPTEAQWEYACRAGSSGDWGLLADGTMGTLDEMGWYWNYSSFNTHAVGTKTPNAWGLYDMHGNVCEWCLDGYSGGGYSGTDPVGATSGFSHRVLRGGSWYNNDYGCRSSNCYYYNCPDDRFYADGLRVAAPAGL